MFEELTAEADRLLAEALDASDERDPRNPSSLGWNTVNF